MTCPKCGSINVDIQLVQMGSESVTTSKTRTKYKQKGHGFFWWIFIGWWWWMIDLFFWIFFFVPRLVIRLFKKKRYKSKSKTVSRTDSHIKYEKIALCKSCGHSWNAK